MPIIDTVFGYHPAGYVPVVPVGHVPQAFFLIGGDITRVTAFIDGFNLYHAIDDLRANHLKWLDLRRLCEKFAPRPQFTLGEVFYFSAYATWLPDKYNRHREFVKALQAVGVTPVMGNFKEKSRSCNACGSNWKSHEEKETDVNIGIHLIRSAYKDSYDRAILITGDSDIGPALRLLKQDFPGKKVHVISPVGRPFSMELAQAVGGVENCRRMQRVHLEKSLFPRDVMDAARNIVAIRPSRYDPPSAPLPPRAP